MTTTQTPAVGDGRGSTSPTAGHHEAAFLAEMNRQHRAGIVLVDNAADRLYSLGQPEYDGPRCSICEDAPVEDQAVPCADCLTDIGDDHWPCPRCDAHWYRTDQSHEAWAARLPVVQAAHLARHDRQVAADVAARLTHLSAVCAECGDLFEPADGETDTVCDSCDATEPDDEPHYYPCPTCGGNGCGPCRGTGERLDTTHPNGQDR